MLSFLFLALAVNCLSLSMAKHFKDCFKRSLKAQWQRALQLSGCCCLLLSLCLMPQTGICYVYWCCQLSALILLQAGLLTLAKNQK